MATLTAVRPTVRPAGRLRTTARPAARPVRRYALEEPSGLGAMRARVAAARADLIGREQVVRVLECVRAGMPLAAVAATADLSELQVLDVVAGIGSRISQANKTGPKVRKEDIVFAGAVRGRGVRPSARRKTVVVIPAGFEPTAPHGRDVTRALAALLIANPAGDERPVARWLAAQSTHLPVEFTHLVHWHFLAQRGTHRLDGAGLFDDDVLDVFCRAFDLLAAEFVGAVGAVSRLLNVRLALPEMAKAADAARWLAPEVDQLAVVAAAAAGGDEDAARRVPALLAHLRRIAEARPARYTPRTLADISREQLRLIAARHKMGPGDIADATRTTRSLEEYSRSVAAARGKVEAELAALGVAG